MSLGNVFDVFAAVRACAKDVAKVDARQSWASACRQIMDAMREVEEQLQDLVELAPVPSDSQRFTYPTAQSHIQAPVETITDDTQEDPDISNIEVQSVSCNLESLPGNLAEANLDFLSWRVEAAEEQLRKERAVKENQEQVAESLFRLGEALSEVGRLSQANQHLEESLRIWRSVSRDRDHLFTAEILHVLGKVSRQGGNLIHAKDQLEESLRMKRSFERMDALSYASTLLELGIVNQRAGEFSDAMQQLHEALRIYQMSGRMHAASAATHRALAEVCREAGDHIQANEHIDEFMRIRHFLEPHNTHIGTL